MNINTLPIVNRCAIVVRGSFNPAILQPGWFSKYSILPSDEIDGLTAEPKKIKEFPEIGAIVSYGQGFTVTNDQAVITFKSFVVEVLRNQFTIRCQIREKIPQQISCIRKIFKILHETPITAYGINFQEHFLFSDDYDTLLEKFFSKNEKLSDVFGESAKYNFKIIAKINGSIITFIIEPSNKIKNGIYFKMNRHYEIKDRDSQFLVDTIKGSFDESKSYFKSVISEHFGEILEKFDG